MKRIVKKWTAIILAMALVITSLTVYADSNNTEYTKHSTYAYLISVSTNKIVTVDTATTDLVANGEMSLLEDIENMPVNALFNIEESQDTRFPDYYSLISMYNNNSVSVRTVNEGGVRADGGNARSGWEVMGFQFMSDGTYVIRSTNGYSNDVSQGAYVKLDENNELIPGTTDVSDAEKFILVLPEGTSIETVTTSEVITTEKELIDIDYGKDAVFTSKKGVCSWYYASENDAQRDVGILKNVGATWTYNWGDTQPAAEEAKELGIEYVPMTWGSWSVNSTEIAKLKAGKESGLYENLLTFNEPDLSEQANMTVDQAIALWPQLESTGLRLGSPVGAAVESAWVDEFMTKAKEKGYRVDFLTVHVYQDFTHPGSVESFRQALERLYNKYKLPIWITELGCIDVEPLWWGYTRYGALTHEASTTYITEVVEMLESLDYVERYAWFVDSSSDINGTAYTRLFDTSTGELTVEGKAFKVAGLVEKEDETTTVVNNEVTTLDDNVTTASGTDNPTVDESLRPGRAKVKKLKIKKRKILNVKLKKVALADGYKVQISTTKKFKKKKRIIRNTTKCKLKIKNIKKPKKFKKVKKYYFVRVRAYKIVNGTKLYSARWSKVKKVKVKK